MVLGLRVFLYAVRPALRGFAWVTKEIGYVCCVEFSEVMGDGMVIQ